MEEENKKEGIEEKAKEELRLEKNNKLKENKLFENNLAKSNQKQKIPQEIKNNDKNKIVNEQPDEILKKIAVKQENQAKFIVIILAFIIVLVFAFAWISAESKKFEYINLNWVKEDFGGIDIYSTILTGNNVKGVPTSFKLTMKNDPREIEDVPLSGKVLIKKTLPVFLSFDLNFEEKCDAGPLIGFGYLMSKLGYDLKTANANETLAKERDELYITCETNTQSTRIILTNRGVKEGIYQHPDFNNCYYMSVLNCDDMGKVIEKFEMEVLKRIIVQNDTDILDNIVIENNTEAETEML